jgi:hypothetical protein
MKFLLVFTLLCAGLFNSYSQSVSPVYITAVVANDGAEGDPPKATVYVQAGKNKVLIENISQPGLMDATASSKKVIDAKSSWWGGGGANYEIELQGENIVVYRKYLEEMADEEFKREKIKTIKLQKLAAKPAVLKTAIIKWLKKK